MSVEEAIFSLITADESVAALIGSRLVPVTLKQGTALPAIVYEQLDDDEDLTTDGALGLIESIFQFTCWAATHFAAVELADTLRAALNDYSGVSAGVTVQHIRVTGRGDVPAQNEQAEQLTRYGKYINCTVSYNNS